eukprot:TRINITY_DN12254_c0_g2_i1.p2 TRINITY_DN12254_c0_g2~~TRINITY_DN12254_c0_g2_i1.p2  ORF type:complete len:124 (-),score=7.79 TRINITY_DN12254_c0_g2_i1:225-596(-)
MSLPLLCRCRASQQNGAQTRSPSYPRDGAGSSCALHNKLAPSVQESTSAGERARKEALSPALSARAAPQRQLEPCQSLGPCQAACGRARCEAPDGGWRSGPNRGSESRSGHAIRPLREASCLP